MRLALIMLIVATVINEAFGQGLLDHNGSLMSLTKLPNNLIEIRYVAPRPALIPYGVLPGVLLIQGQWQGSTLVATAFVFPPGCPPAPYPVRGVVDQANVLTLFGPAPIIAPGCVIVSYEWTGNSELKFFPK